MICFYLYFGLIFSCDKSNQIIRLEYDLVWMLSVANVTLLERQLVNGTNLQQQLLSDISH